MASFEISALCPNILAKKVKYFVRKHLKSLSVSVFHGQTDTFTPLPC